MWAGQDGEQRWQASRYQPGVTNRVMLTLFCFGMSIDLSFSLDERSENSIPVTANRADDYIPITAKDRISICMTPYQNAAIIPARVALHARDMTPAGFLTVLLFGVSTPCS